MTIFTELIMNEVNEWYEDLLQFFVLVKICKHSVE